MALIKPQGAAQCQLKEWDVSRATLSKVEAGLRRVTDAEVYLLAKILGVPVADLFPGEAEVMKAIRNPCANFRPRGTVLGELFRFF